MVTAVEQLALDRAAFDHHALFGVEPVQTRGEQELDRRRNCHVGQIFDRPPPPVLKPQQTVVDEHPQYLLHKQRITLGRVEDPGASGRRDVGLAKQVVDQAGDLVAGQRLEQDRCGVQLAARPAGAQLE